MSLAFEFATSGRIVFGPGTINQLPELASAFGHRVFVLTGSNTQRHQPVLDALQKKGMTVTSCALGKGEPTVSMAADCVRAARQSHSDLVIGIGGGSVLDTGKVVAAMLTNNGELMDYLEVVGKGEPLRSKGAPYIAVTTTAGTGSEVTRNAVLDVEEQGVKVSMRHPWMLPDVALVDPELSHSMSPYLTACTGLDALTQVIEPFISCQRNPLTDGFCREGIRRAGFSLRKAFDQPDNAEARADMSLVNLLGGLALANAKLGAVHGFAGPLGGMLHAPHGALCARLLPLCLQANLDALRQRSPRDPVLPRFAEIAFLLTGNVKAEAEEGIQWIRDLCTHMQIPSLRELGLGEERLHEAVEKSRNSSSMKGNPLPLTDQELAKILQEAL